MQDIKIDFSLQDMSAKTFSFRTLRELVEFNKHEIAAWEQLKSNLSEEARRRVSYDRLFQELTKYVTGLNTEQVDEETPEDRSARISRDLMRYRGQALQQHLAAWLYSGHPAAVRFIEIVNEENFDVANVFILHLTKKQLPELRHYDNFRGVMLAFEFSQVMDKAKQKSLKSFESSLGNLSKRYESSTSDLFTEGQERREALEAAISETYESSRQLQEEQAGSFQKQSAEFSTNFEESYSSWKTRIAELETLYTEKLKFSSPAKYWKKSADKYFCHGALSLLVLLIAMGFGIYQFYSLFTTWLQGKEIALQLNTLQGIVLFASIAALYAFVIKVLARITFSSFHLMRDAQEREQLTYLYLALSNESEMDKDSRDIVLQALFSRTDTGLLGADSGPTMPTGSDLARFLAQSKSP
ncbi:DUF6161 domain-containing protein [Allohahella marinimesophila]|uniref:DUF6161 domain-containing protein n=1 Tax=Allohahella marinimesophila TaxID=1054972 RepID=A0ABP7PTK9_9GAMM